MFAADQYQLLDLGRGEKLENFGGTLIRRPAPAAYEFVRDNPAFWDHAIRFEKDRGWNDESGQVIGQIENHGIRFELVPTPTGQVGIFPEQVDNWDWILDGPDLSGLNAINLFGYTGGTSLALAKRGAKVAHVDAAKSVVGWARKNAEISGLGDKPIRWIVEDAMRFIRREVKRGNRYQIIVADPPSFGRGPKKETWKIQRDLPELVRALHQLTGGECKLMVLSCHTPEFSKDTLARMVRKEFGLASNQGEPRQMAIQSEDGRSLRSGHCFRFRSI